MRGRGFCQICLASFLMLLNFLQAFVSLSIVVYSVWIINHSNHGGHPIPWFSYALMRIGVGMSLFSLIGYIAAETFSACLFSFVSFTDLLYFSPFISVDLPNDPSGEIERLRAFIEDNFDVFRWFGVAVVVTQALSLLLAIVLQTMVSNIGLDNNIDEDYDDYPNRSPLLSNYPRAQV
ncbi:Tetraspanin family protein [Zostera marina]|uniref:Tetraspanin family protein n=1 Tax=Zostera marina TaxID=29655 RepID=A0A0K9PX07_ZOSMR|nr:Tetraspanin family protein [Zostera marina]